MTQLQRQGLPPQETPVKKSLLCKIGLHKSDRDFGIRWHDKATISSCIRCGKNIVHSRMTVYGGSSD